MHALAVAVPAAQHALALEPDGASARLRARVVEVGVCPEPLEPERHERQAARSSPWTLGWRRYPSERRPSQVPTTARRSRRLSSVSPVTPSGRVVAIDDQEVEPLAALALAGEARDVCRGCSIDVYGPHEKNFVTSGSEPSSNSAGRIGRRSRSAARATGLAPPLASMLLLARVPTTGAALRRPREPPALEAVLADARDARSTGSCSGATTRCSDRGRRDGGTALRELPGATWIRGNVDRWTAIPDRGAGDESSLSADRRLPRGARRERRRASSRALPERLAIDDTRYCHASPSPMCARSCPSPPRTTTSCWRACRASGVSCSATPICQFRRTARGRRRAVNPGSVGMPFDGDPRAAYAIVREAARLEHRRVAYDHEASAARGGASVSVTPPGPCAASGRLRTARACWSAGRPGRRAPGTVRVAILPSCWRCRSARASWHRSNTFAHATSRRSASPPSAPDRLDLPAGAQRGADDRPDPRAAGAAARAGRRRSDRRRRPLDRRHRRDRALARRRGPRPGAADAGARTGARQGRRDVARPPRAAGEVVCFLDADSEQFGAHFACGLLGPLLCDRADLVRQGLLPPAVPGRRADAARGRRPRNGADCPAAAEPVLSRARRGRSSRWRARSPRAASCSSGCRSSPATASTSRCCSTPTAPSASTRWRRSTSTSARTPISRCAILGRWRTRCCRPSPRGSSARAGCRDRYRTSFLAAGEDGLQALGSAPVSGRRWAACAQAA